MTRLKMWHVSDDLKKMNIVEYSPNGTSSVFHRMTIFVQCSDWVNLKYMSSISISVEYGSIHIPSQGLFAPHTDNLCASFFTSCMSVARRVLPFRSKRCRFGEKRDQGVSPEARESQRIDCWAPRRQWSWICRSVFGDSICSTACWKLEIHAYKFVLLYSYIIMYRRLYFIPSEVGGINCLWDYNK